MNTPIQHGENVLVEVSNMPQGEVTKAKSIIVGHSETGHHHILTSTVEMSSVEHDGHLHVKVEIDSVLRHQKDYQKHDDIPVKRGVYRIHHKTEYNPITKVLTAVFD